MSNTEFEGGDDGHGHGDYIFLVKQAQPSHNSFLRRRRRAGVAITIYLFTRQLCYGLGSTVPYSYARRGKAEQTGSSDSDRN